MQKPNPHQQFNSPVKGKYNFNNINHYTISELSYVIHRLRKRIADKERYITFLKTELEENGIEYKKKFLKLKEFKNEDNKDYTLDPLLKHEKNIKKKINKRRRKANKRDIHPELGDPLRTTENVMVDTLVNTLEKEKQHSSPRVQDSSEISTTKIEKKENTEVEIRNIDSMEEINKKIYEDLIREQIEKQEEDKREKEAKEKKFKSEYYLRKVRKIQNSNSLYKEILLGDKEGIYSMKDDELDKLLSTTDKEEVQEVLRRDKHEDEKTKDGREMSVLKEEIEEKKEENKKEDKKIKKKVIIEEKKEVVENVQPVIGHRKEEIERPVYKEEQKEKSNFILALHRTISEEMEKDKKKEAKEEKKEQQEEDEKEIDKILRLEQEEIKEKYGGKELTYYLFSDSWKKNLKNDEYRKKKINRMKKILKEIDFEDDKEHLRKQIAYAKQFKE